MKYTIKEEGRVIATSDINGDETGVIITIEEYVNEQFILAGRLITKRSTTLTAEYAGKSVTIVLDGTKSAFMFKF